MLSLFLSLADMIQPIKDENRRIEEDENFVTLSTNENF